MNSFRPLAALLFLFSLCCAAPLSLIAAPPNIILVLADDLGYGDLGSYGQTKIRTPHLDRLAAEGMRFTDAYAGSTVCAPSRSVLMTGLHTGHTRIRGNSKTQEPLRPEDLTVTEVLKKAGYKTACIGKWGLGMNDSSGQPNRKGFDEWFGYLSHGEAHNYYPEQLWRQDKAMPFPRNANDARGDYAPDWFAKAGTNFIRDAYPGPLFLYFASTIPHANNERQREKADGMEVPNDAPYSAEPWPQPERNKAAMITRLDDAVGALVARLKEYRMHTNSIVIVTSDNGPHKEGGNDPEFFNSNGPLRGIKRDLYEGGIRVPFIVWAPGRVAPGVSDLPIAFWDVLPTFAELAGALVPPDLDGLSFAPTLLGRATAQKRHDMLYWEFHERRFAQAIRMGNWKGVRNGPDAPFELYNLAVDIGEKVNLAGANPEMVSKMTALLKAARTESPLWPTTNPAAAAKDKK